MNASIFILIIFLIGFGSVARGAVTFEQANEMLHAGNASQAASAYEELISQGRRSAALYANLGRALQQEGKIATASLNYHRALMLDSQQMEARQGLREVYQKAGVPAEAISMPPVVAGGLLSSAFTPHWIQGTIEKISPLVFLICGGILFWSGAFLLVSLIGRRVSVKNPSFFWPLCLLLVGALLLGIGWVTDPRVSNAHLAIIIASQGETALSQPVETSTRVAFLPPGSPITVLSEREDWNYCRLPNGANAWIPASSLSFVNPERRSDRS